MSYRCISLSGILLVIGMIELEALVSVMMIVTTFFVTRIILSSLSCVVIGAARVPSNWEP